MKVSREREAYGNKMNLLNAIFLAVLIVLVAPAQASFATVATNVSPLSTAYSSQRKLVRDSQGNLFAVYLKKDANRSEVYLSQSSDSGTTWREVDRASKGDLESARATVAIDGKDRLHIFWTEFVPEEGEEEYGQIAYRIYDHGVWSSEARLTSGGAYSGYPSAAVDSQEQIHIVWYGFDGEAYQVFYSRTDRGNWTAPIKLSQGFPDSVNPTIAVDSKDNPHVTWYKSNGRQYQIYYLRWFGTWSEQVVLSSGLTDSFNPSLAVDREDNVYVVWDKGEARRTQIYNAIYSNGVWSQQTALTSGDAGAENPSVAVDSEGTVYVFYDKADGNIYLLKRTNVWSTEERLTSSGENKHPSVRWSYLHNPSNDVGGTIDYVWTSSEAGQTRVLFGQVGIEARPRLQTTELSPLLVTGIIIGAASLLFIALHRRRPAL